MNWYKKLKLARSAKINFTDDDLQSIKELIYEGNSLTQIASAVGISLATIVRLNNKYKWREEAQHKKDIFISNLYLLPPDGKGMPIAQINKDYGISNHRVENALKRLNIFEENWRNKSEAAKYKYENNPELAKEHSKKMKQKYIDHPELLEEMSKRQKQMYIDHPEIAKEHSKMMKQRFIDNPELGKQMSEERKQRYIDNPELREEMSARMKQMHIDNPELGKQMSERMKQFWRDMGGLEGRLLSYPTRDKAITFLHGFFNKIQKEEGATIAGGIYNKYMDIINNYTYPDEIQQEETV